MSSPSAFNFAVRNVILWFCSTFPDIFIWLVVHVLFRLWHRFPHMWANPSDFMSYLCSPHLGLVIQVQDKRLQSISTLAEMFPPFLVRFFRSSHIKASDDSCLKSLLKAFMNVFRCSFYPITAACVGVRERLPEEANESQQAPQECICTVDQGGLRV